VFADYDVGVISRTDQVAIQQKSVVEPLVIAKKVQPHPASSQLVLPAEEFMYSSGVDCLVSLLAGLRKNCSTDFQKKIR